MWSAPSVATPLTVSMLADVSTRAAATPLSSVQPTTPSVEGDAPGDDKGEVVVEGEVVVGVWLQNEHLEATRPVSSAALVQTK